MELVLRLTGQCSFGHDMTLIGIVKVVCPEWKINEPPRDRVTYGSIIAEIIFVKSCSKLLDITIHDPSTATTSKLTNHTHEARTTPTISVPPSPSNCCDTSDSASSWSTTATAQTAPCASRWPAPRSSNSPSPSSCRQQCCNLDFDG